MEPTLESIKGGGGSVKVGATGTIISLMSKELDPLTNPISRPKSKANEASSSRTTTSPFKNHHKKGSEILRKAKNHTGSRTHKIPMLTADNSVSIDGTPVRRSKPVRTGPMGVVEIVDIKCGGPDRKWVNPIKDRLKKLNFSKLSETII